MFDTESTQTARTRLLASGKTLFARLGYEQTSTAAIAREALTSESQLVRHFEGKAGLLAAIFDGTCPSSFAPAAVAAALIGAAEGMIREGLMARRAGRPAPYTEEEMVSVFTSMLTGLSAAPARTSSSIAAAG